MGIKPVQPARDKALRSVDDASGTSRIAEDWVRVMADLTKGIAGPPSWIAESLTESDEEKLGGASNACGEGPAFRPSPERETGRDGSC